MAAYKKSNWVTFLRRYGPTASNDNMYDEHIVNSAKRNGVEQPRFSSGGLLTELVANFKGEQPKSVILTGTAGDGKTFLCRETWLAIGGSEEVWNSDDKHRRMRLDCGVTLTVIKDLSELNDADVESLGPLADAVFGQDPREIFLIAANDGQLRAKWEQVRPRTELVEATRRVIDELLVMGQLRAEKAGLKLYNLSRQSSADLMRRVLAAITEHPGWGGCDGCPGQSGDPSLRCPVWENRERLRGELFQTRLTDLLELCDQSGYHLPVRQLLILVSNMLLGHPDAKDGLLRCQDVEGVVRRGRTHLGALYRNAFGENLSENRREGTAVFEVLRRLGIGEETSNRIDNLLVYGHDDPDLREHFQALFGNDPLYGAGEDFTRHLNAYLDGSDPEKAQAFSAVVVSQRQRLFFTMPRERAEELGLWELTVLQSAGEYLEKVLVPLAEGRPVDQGIVRRLVRGLNRVFTGMLTSDNDRLWLASSGSHSQARVCRIAEGEIPVAPKLGQRVAVQRSPEGAIIAVQLTKDRPPVTLPLHLVRFEFLLRVAEGALPTNFSRECYEDILSFKSRLLREWHQLVSDDGEEGGGAALQVLTVTERGALEAKTIAMCMEGTR